MPALMAGSPILRRGWGGAPVRASRGRRRDQASARVDRPPRGWPGPSGPSPGECRCRTEHYPRRRTRRWTGGRSKSPRPQLCGSDHRDAQRRCHDRVGGAGGGVPRCAEGSPPRRAPPCCRRPQVWSWPSQAPTPTERRHPGEPVGSARTSSVPMRPEGASGTSRCAIGTVPLYRARTQAASTRARANPAAERDAGGNDSGTRSPTLRTCITGIRRKT